MAFKGKASNFFVWIILALLIVGLAGFGVTSFGSNVQSVASVGETEVTVSEYGNALDRALSARQQQTGERLSMAEAQATGVDTAVLQGLLGTAALDEAAREAGLSVGDEAVSQRILDIDAFRGLDGGFDRQAYESTLRRNNLTAVAFENTVRRDVARGLLQTALVEGISPSRAYSDTIYDFVGEQRSVTYATLGPDSLDEETPAPDDAAVQTFYDENPDLFTLPQRKALTYGWLSPDMIIDTVEIDEASLRQAYEDREGEFVQPARRIVDRLAFPDDAAADAAKAALDAGETSFDALVGERDLAPGDIDLGDVTEGELGVAGADIFALQDTGIAGPLPSPVGPALFRVNAILEAQTTSFEEAKPALRDDLARDRARRVIADQIDTMDDLLAGGATIEDLGRETDMKTGQMQWAGGMGEGLAAYPEFADAAGNVTEDDFPEIVVLDDGGLFAVRMDRTIPSEVQPLEDVRARAAELARDQAIRSLLSDKADAMVAAIDVGEEFESLGLPTATETALTRRDTPDGLPAAVLEEVFKLDVGAIEIVEGSDSVYLVRLDSIEAPDPEDQAGDFLRSTLNQQAAQSMAQDILRQVIRAVQTRTGISVNQAALNAVNSQLQ